MTPHVYLLKDNDRLVSHCKCRHAMITYPPRVDCPWCGCGWLFTCIVCRRAFTFARGVLMNETWEATARRDLTNLSRREPSADDIAHWVEDMKELLAKVQPGQQYVCLDGRIIPTDTVAVCFQGWHARHDFDFAYP